MKKITARTSLTLSSERNNRSFGRRYDVPRTGFATESHPAETSGLGGQLDLLSFGTQPELVLQMVGSVCIGRCGGTAESFAGASHEPLEIAERHSPSYSRYARSTDAATWAARTISLGWCSDDPSRTGVFELRPLAFAAQHRACAAAWRSHFAGLSAPAACRFQRLSGASAQAQQPATSAGPDRAALPERLAAAVVLPGLPGRLRWSRFRRISAQTQAGNGTGVYRASLAAFG